MSIPTVNTQLGSNPSWDTVVIKYIEHIAVTYSIALPPLSVLVTTPCLALDNNESLAGHGPLACPVGASDPYDPLFAALTPIMHTTGLLDLGVFLLQTASDIIPEPHTCNSVAEAV